MALYERSCEIIFYVNLNYSSFDIGWLFLHSECMFYYKKYVDKVLIGFNLMAQF